MNGANLQFNLPNGRSVSVYVGPQIWIIIADEFRKEI